jgi:hypothetical protein
VNPPIAALGEVTGEPERRDHVDPVLAGERFDGPQVQVVVVIV